MKTILQLMLITGVMVSFGCLIGVVSLSVDDAASWIGFYEHQSVQDLMPPFYPHHTLNLREDLYIP